ncbi:unnamed protein product [Moneuplotes crassus]|uniref:UDENN domain-containing protein n=1 Tax=Euplotes crassus TaxID=5936 RepID=A0AAD2D2I4_EUPCR|nr:unnamed protein product [Moneuplotes crassus]
MNPRHDKIHRMKSFEYKFDFTEEENVEPFKRRSAQNTCPKCEYLSEENSVLKKQYEDMVIKNIQLEKDYENIKYERDELNRLIAKAGWTKNKIQKFLKNRDVMKAYDPNQSPKLEIDNSFSDEDDQIPDESSFDNKDTEEAVPTFRNNDKIEIVNPQNYRKDAPVEAVNTPKINHLPRHFTNQSKNAFNNENKEPFLDLDEEILTEEDYIEIEDDSERHSPRENSLATSPWRTHHYKKGDEEVKYIKEGESSSSTSENEDTGSDYSDSSYAREEAFDKTIVTRQMQEEFKGYLYEDSLLDSRPIFEPSPHRRKLRRESNENENNAKKERLADTPDILSKGKKKIRPPTLNKKRSATMRITYNPTEDKQYMDDILKSVNNKNHLLLNPQYGSIFNGESIKIGRSIYLSSTGKKSILQPYPKCQVPLREVSYIPDDESLEILSGYSPFEDKTDEFRMKRADSKEIFSPVNKEDFGEIGSSFFGNEDVSEHISQINLLPLAPEFKNLKNPKFMEEFYIIGVDDMTLMSLNSSHEIVRPSLLYNYPNSEEHAERHRVIKDFCFPIGIGVEKIDLSKPDLEIKISDALYNRKIYLYDTFIFTLNGNDYNKGIIYEDEHLYCLTIVVKELVSPNVKEIDLTGQMEEQLFLSKKAYCIMFRNTHFELQYKLLSALSKIQKHEQANTKILESNQRLSGLNILPEYKDLVNDIESMISMPIISDLCMKTLKEFYELNPKDFKPKNSLTLPIPYKVCKFQYKIPESVEYLDINWYGPFFISWIKFEDFYYLFKAILLEKSIVFVSKNHGLITSMVNAFRVLMKPFKWCHLFISLLPKLLKDYLCAPQPILLALSDKQEFFESLPLDAFDDKVIVESNENSRIHVEKVIKLPDFKCSGLSEKLEKMFKGLKKENTNSIRNSVYDTSSPEKAFSENLAKTIKAALEKEITSVMKKYKIKQKKSHLQPEFSECKMFLIKNSQDRPFMQEFVDTQMFAFYYDMTVNK